MYRREKQIILHKEKKMSKKFQMFLALLLTHYGFGSLRLTRPAEPVVEATEAVVEEVVTEPVVETGPDVLALFTDLTASLPADKATAPSVQPKLNEELVDTPLSFSMICVKSLN